MSVNFVNEYEKLDGNTNLSLDKIFVRIGERSIPLSELFVYVNDSTKRKVKSFNDFKKAKNIVTKENSFINDRQVYSKLVAVPTLYESDYISGGTKPTDLGLKRVHLVEPQDFDLSGANIFVYAKLSGDSNYDFCRVDELGYYENGSYVSIANKKLEDLKGKTIYSLKKNKAVENLFTGSSFKFGDAVAVEQFDKGSLSHTVFERDSNGNIVKTETGEIKTTTESLDNKYSELTLKKIDNKTYVEAVSYDVNGHNEGNFVQILFKGESIPMLVNKNDLFLSDVLGKRGAKANAENWTGDLVGKKLFVKVGEEYKETEPLTVQQFNLSYNAIKTMQPSLSDEDILTENSHLRLSNGKFVKETEVAKPIAYQIVDHNEANFDALLVYCSDENGNEKSLVVDKSTFDKSPKVVVNGLSLDIQNAYKIKQCALSTSCHVIQTSSKGAKAEDCLSLSKAEIERSTVNEGGINRFKFNETAEYFHSAQVDELTKSMLEAYKKGEYKLTKTVDEKGNVILLDDKNNRFVFSEKVLMELDPLNTYNLLKSNEISFDGKALKGGPKFDYKKANKAGFKEYKSWLATAAQFTFSIPGVLIMFAVPVLGIAMAGSLLAAPPLIYGINAIRARRVNHRKTKFNNPTTEIRKQNEKSIEKELQTIYDKVKEATKALTGTEEEIAAKKEAIGRKFLTDYELVQRKIDVLHTSKFNQEFKMVDNKAKINENNASLMTKFNEEITALDKEIKQLTKLAKKDPSKKAELDAKLAEKEGKFKFYESRGLVLPKSKKAKALQEKAEMVKGLVLAKFFQVTPIGNFELSMEEKNMLSQLDYKDQKLVLSKIERVKEKNKARKQALQLERRANNKNNKANFKDSFKKIRLSTKLRRNGKWIAFAPELDIVTFETPQVHSALEAEIVPPIETAEPVVEAAPIPKKEVHAKKKKEASFKDSLLKELINGSHKLILEKLQGLDTTKKIANFVKKFEVKDEKSIQDLRVMLDKKCSKNDGTLIRKNSKCFDLYRQLILAYGNKELRKQFEVENTADTVATV